MQTNTDFHTLRELQRKREFDTRVYVLKKYGIYTGLAVYKFEPYTDKSILKQVTDCVKSYSNDYHHFDDHFQTKGVIFLRDIYGQAMLKVMNDNVSYERVRQALKNQIIHQCTIEYHVELARQQYKQKQQVQDLQEMPFNEQEEVQQMQQQQEFQQYKPYCPCMSCFCRRNPHMFHYNRNHDGLIKLLRLQSDKVRCTECFRTLQFHDLNHIQIAIQLCSFKCEESFTAKVNKKALIKISYNPRLFLMKSLVHKQYSEQLKMIPLMHKVSLKFRKEILKEIARMMPNDYVKEMNDYRNMSINELTIWQKVLEPSKNHYGDFYVVKELLQMKQNDQ